jgi:hypothetical protein
LLKNLRRFADDEIATMRPAFEARCKASGSCEAMVVITTTPKGKYVVLNECEDGPFVLDTNDRAVWVGEGGNLEFHRCPELMEIM